MKTTSKTLKVYLGDQLVLEMDEEGNSKQDQVPSLVAAIIHDWLVTENPLKDKLLKIEKELQNFKEEVVQLREDKKNSKEFIAETQDVLGALNNKLRGIKRKVF